MYNFDLFYPSEEVVWSVAAPSSAGM